MFYPVHKFIVPLNYLICNFLIVAKAHHSKSAACTIATNSIDKSFSNTSENVLCFSSQFCSKPEGESTCNLFSSFEFLKSVIKEIRIQQKEEKSWLQFVLQLSPSPTYQIPVPESKFIFKVFVGERDDYFCYEFWIAFNQISQNLFILPSIQTKFHFLKHLDIQLSTFFKYEDKTDEEILFSQEGKYFLHENFDSQTVKVWDLKTLYSFDHIMFHLTLKVPANFNCKMWYKLSLHENKNVCDTKSSLHTWIGSTYVPDVSLNCSKRTFKYLKKYCIVISLNSSQECMKGVNHEEIIFFQNVPPNSSFSDESIEFILCKNWNVSILMKSDSSKKSILVHLKLCQGMERLKKCFFSYLVNLYKLPSKVCDWTAGIRYSTFQLSLNHGETSSKQFSDLKNGYYCIILQPCGRENCYENWSIHSNAVYIFDSVQNSSVVSQFEESSVTITAVACSLTLLLIFILNGMMLVLYCKYKYRFSRFVTMKRGVENDKVEELHQLLTTTIEVFILYYYDPATKRNIELLKDFLQNCAGFQVTLDENIMHEILINRSTYLNKMLQYKCSNVGDTCNSAKRFIVVETENAIQYIKSKFEKVSSLKTGRKPGEKYSSLKLEKEYELEQSFFCQAVSSILINWRRCLQDYCHLFVVRFDDHFEYEVEIPITTNDRYEIPRDLVNLCINLSCSAQAERNASRDKLSFCLKKHPIKQIFTENCA